MYLTTNSDGLEFAMRWNRKQDRSTGVYEENEERQLRTVSRMKLHSENVISYF